jgi:hypothetical protein
MGEADFVANSLRFGASCQVGILDNLAKAQSLVACPRGLMQNPCKCVRIHVGLKQTCCLLQVNKNLLLKARMGTDAAVASVAFKAWWQPSFTLGVSAGYDLQKRKPVFGFVCNCENYGNIR